MPKPEKTLGLMKRSPDERVVPPTAREVCQREGAKAVIGGSILRLGNKYVLDLAAADCLSVTRRFFSRPREACFVRLRSA